MFIKPETAKAYIDQFNQNDEELFIQGVANRAAWEWLSEAMPRFECPEHELEETFYFRWWVYRKHLKQTPDGYIISEFLPEVPWAGRYNSINCAAGHHFYEGRWLGNQSVFLRDYALFWLRKGGSLRSYSTWLADAIWQAGRVSGDLSLALELLPDLVSNYRAWEAEHLHPCGLFWSVDDRDGMEFSISGSGLRPTLNSYMYADAMAIAAIARLAGKTELEAEFSAKAGRIQTLVQERLWDAQAGFFKCIPLASKDTPVATWDFAKMDPAHNAREQVGFIPWAYHLPGAGYETAWKQLLDPDGFQAPFGPTTAERRHPRFMFKHDEHECLWNGPSWPFSTCQTLMGMANLLDEHEQAVISRQDYLDWLKLYAHSHYRTRPDGKRVNWLDENLDPFTGDWLSRTILEKWGWRKDKGGRERGKDYNHSTFNDLVISGLVGVKPDEMGGLRVNPLVPQGAWAYFCLDNLALHGHRLSVVYDAAGTRYGQGQGLRVFVDGKLAASRQDLGALSIGL